MIQDIVGRMLRALIVLGLLCGTAAADTLGALTFSPPDGWEAQSAKTYRVTYKRGSAYIAISVGEVSTLDLPADTTAEQLARSYEMEGKIQSASEAQVAGTPGFALLYQAGQGLSLVAATLGGGGTVFVLETTRANRDDDLATFATLIDAARLPAVKQVAVEDVPRSPLAATELAALPDAKARKLAATVAQVIVDDDRKAFTKLLPKKLAIGKKKHKRAALAKTIAKDGVGALFGWDPEAPVALVFDRAKPKRFGVYRGNGFGVIAVLWFTRKGKAWSLASVSVTDFGEEPAR